MPCLIAGAQACATGTAWLAVTAAGVYVHLFMVLLPLTVWWSLRKLGLPAPGAIHQELDRAFDLIAVQMSAFVTLNVSPGVSFGSGTDPRSSVAVEARQERTKTLRSERI